MKKILLVIRVVGLIAIHFICFALISAALFPPPAKELTPEEAGAALTALLAVSLLSTIVLAHVIIRSRYLYQDGAPSGKEFDGVVGNNVSNPDENGNPVSTRRLRSTQITTADRS